MQNERARMKKHADEIHEKLETIVKGSQDGKLDKQGIFFFNIFFTFQLDI